MREEYRLVRQIKFDSARRMMSVIVADQNGDLFIFSKGADSAILPLCADKESEKYKSTVEHIEKFAEQGMRTLAFAYRALTDVSEAFLNACSDEQLEAELSLLGATGVEDMLQEDVQKCISDFQEAGVRTWIVTGDKNSTAKCIG